MKPKQTNKQTTGKSNRLAAISVALLTSATAHAQLTKDPDWQAKAIAPVGNPLYFEDPRIYTELRPVFMQHWLPDNFYFEGGKVPLGGEVHVYAAQIRVKLTDRLALIATKDGYIEFQPDHTLAHSYGWADVAAGLKYALIDDREKQLIVTPGFTVTLPVGSEHVFQSHGSGEENVFVSAEKGWDNFHVTGNLGLRIPNNFDEQTLQLHYSLQLDYFVHRYFIPFFVANGYTILSNGKNTASQALTAVPLNTEGYDLINFGASKAGGRSQLTVGGGARSKVTKNVDLGVAYEIGVVKHVGIFDSRLTADVSLHF